MYAEVLSAIKVGKPYDPCFDIRIFRSCKRKSVGVVGKYELYFSAFYYSAFFSVDKRL